MSEWAIGDGDNEERTAYEYRELYIDQGVIFERFRCPFCQVPLTPVNLYKTEEVARSPHFRADKEPHRHGCDGSPMLFGKWDQKSVIRRVEKRRFYLPEALVPRRPMTTHVAQSLYGALGKPDEHEVSRRRQEAAGRLGPAVYRTSLIRSVAIAFLGVFKESYKQQKYNDWSEERRRKWAMNLLKESRLTLYDGFTLTYQNAIRNTRFPPPPKPRIFHGWGLVTRAKHTKDHTEYILEPDTMVEHAEGEEVKHYRVEITIRMTHESEPTGSQRLTIRKLEKASIQGLQVRWFAYGLMYRKDGGVYGMIVENIDHLYLHALRKPVG